MQGYQRLPIDDTLSEYTSAAAAKKSEDTRVRLMHQRKKYTCPPAGFLHLAKFDYLELDLSYNKRLEFTKTFDLLAQLPNLRVLALIKCHSGTIPTNIGKLKSLQKLILWNNDLSALPEQIAELENLEELNLRTNKLKQFPTPILALKNLKKLTLKSNRFGKLPDEIFDLKKLEYLDISSCALTGLSDKIGQLKNLKELNIQSNKIKDLPDILLKMKSLEKIHVRGNKELDNEKYYQVLNKIGQNEYLNMSNSDLEELTDTLLSLKTMKQLNLSGNKLSKLPEFVTELSALETIDLSNNKFEVFPEILTKIKTLKNINISQNFLKTLPASIGNLENLVSLNITKNVIEALPKTVKKMTNLTNIIYDSSQNLDKSLLPVSRYEQEIYVKSKEDLLELKDDFHLIKKLTYGNSSETNLPVEICELLNLESLNISFCRQLTTLPEGLAGLSKLRALRVFQCPLIENMNFFFDKLTGLNLLNINHVSCDELLPFLPKYQHLETLAVYLKNDFIPNGIEKLSKLQTLTIASDNLRLLPEGLRELPNFKRLTLQPQTADWSRIMHVVGQLQHLENLYVFSRNGAISDFSMMKNLKKMKTIGLHLSGREASNFTQLLDVLGELPLLEDVGLTINTEEIPHNLGKIGHLNSKSRKIRIQPLEHHHLRLSIETALAKLPIPAFWTNTRNQRLVDRANAFIKKYQNADLTDFERYVQYSLEMKELGLLKDKLPFHQSKYQHKSDNLFFVAGRVTGMTKKEIAETSEQTKIGIASKFNPQVTHGVLTPTTSESVLQKFFAQGVMLLTEDDFKELLWQENTPYLMEVENESSAENLIRLLFSDDDDNIALALELIGGGGASEKIIPYLTAIAYFSKDAPIRNQARKYFRKYASRSLQEHLKKTWKDGYRNRAHDEFMKSVGQHDDIDPVEFYLMVHRLRAVGIADLKHRAQKMSQIILLFPFKTIPDAIYSFPNIKSIHIRSNEEIDFVSVFEKLAKLNSLHTFSIHNAFLKNVPIQIFNLQQVNSISIEGWKITDLFANGNREEMRKMNNLKTLKLRTGNQGFSENSVLDLDYFPNLTNLIVNGIPHRQIKNLDKKMGLESLVYGYADLKVVPPAIAKMQDLKQLNLDGNQISAIPDAVQTLPRLEELSLLNNQISKIPLEFMNNREYVKLILTRNKITEIPLELFSTNAKKWTVSLAENPIEKAPENLPKVMELRHGYGHFELNLYRTPLVKQPIVDLWKSKYAWLRISGY